MDRSPQTSPGQAGTQQPIRPPYLDEDAWTSSTPPKDTSHWTRVRRLLNKCDGDTIGSWQEEINTQLIVASLLSTLTGAFVVETQKSLSEDPTVTAAVLLSHIAMQLNASVSLPPSTLQPFSNPPPNARTVNSLLYVSLGFSLSNVTLGLLCLQWLRELKSDPPGIADKRYPIVHSVRHTGFQKWGAKSLVSTLPLLLLSSLTCFFAGLLLHVSTTDWVVSLPIGVVIGVTFAVLVLTTLVPAVVVAGCATFHRGALGGGYPPIPPFQSLQSWISLQLVVTILRSPIFRKLATFPDSLRELKRCPDWGRVSFDWQYQVASADPILLPFLHSPGNPSTFNDVSMCLFDTGALKQVPDDNPIRMKTQTLCYFIERYSKELPSATLADLDTQLAIQLVHYFNDGGDFSDLGNPATNFAMNIETLPTDVRSQLLHAVVQSYECKLPVIDSSWDFFWLVIKLYMGASRYPTTSPMLVIRALDVVGEYGKQYSTARIAVSFSYRHFVYRLSHLLTSYRPYTTTHHGKRVVTSILFHPVWNELVSTTRALPPPNTPTWVLEALNDLDRLKDEHALHDYAPLSFNWTAQLYPDSEARQSYISVNMDLESGFSVPADDEKSESDHIPPIFPSLSLGDVVERDMEEGVVQQLVDLVPAAVVIHIGETDHPISSVPPSVHSAEMGDDRHAKLRKEELEDDLSASRRMTSHLVDGD